MGSVSRAPASFWLHLIGGLLISVPIVHWWHTSTFDWALISAVAFVFVGIAHVTRRSSWAVLATIGFFAATIHFVGGSPTQIAEGVVAGGVGTSPASSSLVGVSSSIAGWSWALAFGLLGLWLVLLGLVGRRPATAPPAVSPAA